MPPVGAASGVGRYWSDGAFSFQRNRMMNSVLPVVGAPGCRVPSPAAPGGIMPGGIMPGGIMPGGIMPGATPVSVDRGGALSVPGGPMPPLPGGIIPGGIIPDPMP